MNTNTKDKLLGIMPDRLRQKIKAYKKFRYISPNASFAKIIMRGKVIHTCSKIDDEDDYVRQMDLVFNKIRYSVKNEYIYPFDPFVFRGIARTPICSITVDFEKVLESNLNSLRSKLEVCQESCFSKRELQVINVIEALSSRISKTLKQSNQKRELELGFFFTEILYRKPQNLDEALQKILFYNALFWQMGHSHIGLGRLDMILWPYYDKDIREKVLTQEEAKKKICNFIRTLGGDIRAKSLTINGDTGQYILLGGIDKNGRNVNNALTYLFLDVFSELKIPDPKLILRVNSETNEKVWSYAIKCIMTGIGSPLIMNETVVMNKMTKYGYSPSDVWNVGTSACWEPLVIGKSFDQNNPFKSAVAIKPLNKVLLDNNEIKSFSDLLSLYKAEYKTELENVVKDIKFDCSPLFSLFFDDCIARGRDFSNGGAIYSYHGAQVVGLPNVVNALLNIKEFVYEKQMFSIQDCRKAIELNFEGMEDFRALLLSSSKKFGSTDIDVVNITNELISYTGEIISELKSNGNAIKVGFSSPSYIYESKGVKASLDGRKEGEPFAVHISPVSSDIDISEILDFASLLKYKDNCINGNVVDFILPSSYVKQQNKLVDLLKMACIKGVFELQLNVLDKATLVDAKAHPEKYPDLIVRVWGFSAYFNDLPEEFKDNLIHRAELYEVA